MLRQTKIISGNRPEAASISEVKENNICATFINESLCHLISESKLPLQYRTKHFVVPLKLDARVFSLKRSNEQSQESVSHSVLCGVFRILNSVRLRRRRQ